MSKMPLVASIYNPQNQTKEGLIDSFVVRKKTFSKLFKEIEEAKMEVPEQHHLIIGKRGLGKTTLLLRLAYEIERSPNLNTWLIPVVFNEEEYGIRKLYKFWIRIAELLEEKEAAFYGFPQEMEELSKQYANDIAYEKAIFEVLSERLKKQEKKIVLFIDNVGDMFTKFTDLEAHRLRKILQTSTDIRIFAASSKYIESFFQYKHPFYEFFKITQLEGLNQKETESLLIKLGELYGYKDTIHAIIENQKGRIEALRRLTGGVIRTIVLLFEIFIDEQKGAAFTDLEGILDRVTPLYKHRMDDLPKQQQEIVEAIALSWSAVNVKEIRQKTRMESKMISAQLSHLVKNGVINRILTTTKNHLYQINERFFNIWYLMRCGRKGNKQQVIWLVKFFELWCTGEKDIVDRVQQHINHLKAEPDCWASNINLDFIYSGAFENDNEAERKSIHVIQLAINNKEDIEAPYKKLIPAFIGLLSREKYDAILKLLTQSDGYLKAKFQPIYYALMHYLQEEYPNEYLRMGAELKETVEEIIAEVEERKRTYEN